ncbi:GNAT family N-acetyltransferase [Dyadobacter chenhuakuii]|uniref:GNAT family N-acetyltransferase n=1 Tax=Dyadobacter chenhuakuii TaxID=2909339 RepID=A0A9X1QGX0_9BACT|nr:GNAT family N-acetyltransferase [Dyadobacter chenhuakuii]MCF2500102.1 GNAT family N-acetyltransferase [Dyadobacter chenhuakuii]
MKATILESERLVLQPLNSKHLSEKYVNWLNDPEVNMYLASGGDYTYEMLRDYIDKHEREDILFWAIFVKQTGEHIGNIKIDPIDEGNNTGEYGIMIGDRESWGKGFAYEASRLVINHCFKQLGLSGITLGVLKSNVGAVKLYRKLNFTDLANEKHSIDSIRMFLRNE